LEIVKAGHTYAVLGFFGMATTVLLGVGGMMFGGCGSSTGAAAGDSCFTATDCAEGLYCFGVTQTASGTCTSNPDKAQPPAGDGSLIDGGLAPMLDGPGMATDTSTPPPKDSASPTDTSTGKPETAPPAETGPTDTGSGTKDSTTG
jgi:hypothetical protein